MRSEQKISDLSVLEWLLWVINRPFSADVSSQPSFCDYITKYSKKKARLTIYSHLSNFLFYIFFKISTFMSNKTSFIIKTGTGCLPAPKCFGITKTFRFFMVYSERFNNYCLTRRQFFQFVRCCLIVIPTHL